MHVYRLLHRAADIDTTKQAGLPYQFVKQALLLDQFGRRIELSHSSVVKYHNAIAVQNRVDTVRNRNDRPILEHVASECGLQQCIRLHINSGLE